MAPHRPYYLISFPTGREGTPRAVVDRSALLKELLFDGEASHKAPTVELPRALFRTWALESLKLSGKKQPSKQWESAPHLVHLIKAADFLVDEEALQKAASALAASMFSGKDLSEAQQIDTSALEGLSDDQCLHVLRAVPLPQLLAHLPPQQHRLAILAHHPSIESSKQLLLPAVAPQATCNVASSLASFPSITKLAFRPWLRDEAMNECLEKVQLLPHLESLDLSGMHLGAAACTALRACLENMPQLHCLDLSNCSLHTSTLRELLPGVCAIPKLYELSLRRNTLLAEGSLLLAKHFSRLTSLKRLDLAQTSVYTTPAPPGSVSPLRVSNFDFAPYLTCLSALEHLDLEDNFFGPDLEDNFHAEAVGTLSEIVSTLPHFTSLKVNDCWWVPFAQPVPDALRMAQQDLGGDDGGGLMMLIGLQNVLQDTPACVSHLLLKLHSHGLGMPSVGHDKHWPQHVTSLTLILCQMDKEAAFFAGDLGALTQLQSLSCSVGTKDITDSEVGPFASCLSCFRSLTALTFVHSTRKTAKCKYVEPLAAALAQLCSLKHVHIDVAVSSVNDALQLGQAFSALRALETAYIGSPNEPMLSCMVPHLPTRTLKKFSLMVHLTESLFPVPDLPCGLDAFATQASRLTALENLAIGVNVIDSMDVCELATAFEHLQRLTEVNLKLNGGPLIGGWLPAWLPACAQIVADDLFSSLRNLPELQKLYIHLDAWFPSAGSLLFKPGDGGLTCDPHWKALKLLGVSALMNEGIPPCGIITLPETDVVFRALCCAERLEQLCAATCRLTQESIAPLLLRTSLPCLRSFQVSCCMSASTAKTLGRALSGLHLPCLENVHITVEGEDFVSSGNRPQRAGNDVDTALRCVMLGFGELQLPCLQQLELTGVTARVRYGTNTLSVRERHMHAQHAREFGASIAAVLRSTQQLRNLKLATMYITPDCVRLIASCIKNLPGLATLCLGCAEIGVVGSQALVQHAWGHEALERFRMDASVVDDKCVGSVCDWLASLPNLQKSIFQRVQFGPQGIEVRIAVDNDAVFYSQFVCAYPLSDSECIGVVEFLKCLVP